MIAGLGGRDNIKAMPYFHLVRGFDIKNQGDFSWLIETMYKYEPEMLIIDPLYKLSLSTSLVKEDDTAKLIERFDTLRTKFSQINIAIAHHPRKSIGGIQDNSWDSAYGSFQLYAAMDYEIRLNRKGKAKDNRFEFSHISNDVPHDNFTFKRNPFTLLYELETVEDVQSQ